MSVKELSIILEKEQKTSFTIQMKIDGKKTTKIIFQMFKAVWIQSESVIEPANEIRDESDVTF